MIIPTLTGLGLVRCPPGFFDHWIVDHTLSRGLHQLSGPSASSLEWRLQVYGSALAADVASADFGWEGVSSRLARAATSQGVSTDIASIILGRAWQWGRENPTAWMILPRLFIWDATEETLVNTDTGLCFGQVAFDRRFDKYCPLAGLSMTEFLIAEELIIPVEVTIRDRSLARQFYLHDDLLAFNYA